MDSQKDSKGCIIGSYYWLEFTDLFIYHNLLNLTSKVFKAFMSKFGKIYFKLFSLLLYLLHWPLWGWVTNGTNFVKPLTTTSQGHKCMLVYIHYTCIAKQMCSQLLLCVHEFIKAFCHVQLCVEKFGQMGHQEKIVLVVYDDPNIFAYM